MCKTKIWRNCFLLKIVYTVERKILKKHTVDYILGNEYKAPTTAYETELLNAVDKLDSSKKEQLLRIAKVL